MDIPPDIRKLPVFIGDFLTNAGTDGRQQLEEKLATLVNELIRFNFSQLVNLLYQLDVDERKVHNALSDHSNHNAGKLIAELIIERQLQKKNPGKSSAGIIL